MIYLSRGTVEHSIPRTCGSRAVTCSHTAELIVVAAARGGHSRHARSFGEVSEKPHCPVILLAMLQDEVGDRSADGELIVGSHTVSAEVAVQLDISREMAGSSAGDIGLVV